MVNQYIGKKEFIGIFVILTMSRRTLLYPDKDGSTE